MQPLVCRRHLQRHAHAVYARRARCRALCGQSRPILVALSDHTVSVGAPPRTLVDKLSLTIREGEHLAILGANGCGKSVTAQLLARQVAQGREACAGARGPSRGAVPAGAAEAARLQSPAVLISFEAQRGLLLRERKEFRESRFETRHKRATVASYLFPQLYPEEDPEHPGGYFGYRPPRTRLAPLPVPYDAGSSHRLLAELEAAVCAGEIGKLLQQLGLHEVRHQPLYGLSTGQLRKLMLADALLCPPDLLVLDEALDGLDEKSRHDVKLALEELCSGTLITIAHRKQDLVLSPSRVLLLGQGLDGTGYDLGPWSEMQHAAEAAVAAQPAPQRSGAAEPTSGQTQASQLPRDPLVEMREVSIRYGENVVFDRLSWTVREGENWAVVGPNGSGKSTLIDLITSENPLAYQQDMSFFGRKKGSGESVWDIKRQLGVISTDLHMEYADFADPANPWFARLHAHITAWDVVCSGFFDSIGLYEEVGASQRVAAQAWVDAFDLADIIVQHTGSERGSARSFSQLSFGQQKLVLLCRAMVKSPRLLLLDEPTHGLSGRNRERLLGMLVLLADDAGVGIILVTHRRDEIDALGFENVLFL